MKNISLKEWIITGAVALVMTIGLFFLFRFGQNKGILSSICSASFASGALMFFFGLLVWCTNNGAFTGLTYGFSQIFVQRRSQKGFENRERYSEYKERKLQNPKSFVHMVLVGGIFIIISLIFYVISLFAI